MLCFTRRNLFWLIHLPSLKKYIYIFRSLVFLQSPNNNSNNNNHVYHPCKLIPGALHKSSHFTLIISQESIFILIVYIRKWKLEKVICWVAEQEFESGLFWLQVLSLSSCQMLLLLSQHGLDPEAKRLNVINPCFCLKGECLRRRLGIYGLIRCPDFPFLVFLHLFPSPKPTWGL